MQKKLALMFTMLFCLVVVMLTIINKSTFAQSFFTPAPAKPEAQVAPAAPSGVSAGQAVLSPNEFRSAVGALGQENMNKLSQQTSKDMPKTAPPPPVLTPSTTAPGVTAEPGTTQPPTISAEPGTEQTMPEGAPPTVTGAPPAATTAPATTPEQPGVSGGQIPTGQSQIYTGFGGGSKPSEETSKQPPSSTSTGWSIKY